MTHTILLRILPLLVAIFLSGCAGGAVKSHPQGPKQQLANVYRPPVAGQISRVAILPVAGNIEPPETLRTMDETFAAEFNKTQIFEGVRVPRSVLMETIHQDQLSSTEAVPREILNELQRKYSAEAVLFVDITNYRPYRPIAMTVRTKLVSLHNNEVLWAIDSAFDSAEPAVANAARVYGKVTEQNPEIIKPSDSSGVLLSPQRFSRFVAREIFATLPKRIERQ